MKGGGKTHYRRQIRVDFPHHIAPASLMDDEIESIIYIGREVSGLTLSLARAAPWLNVRV